MTLQINAIKAHEGLKVEIGKTWVFEDLKNG